MAPANHTVRESGRAGFEDDARATDGRCRGSNYWRYTHAAKRGNAADEPRTHRFLLTKLDALRAHIGELLRTLE